MAASENKDTRKAKQAMLNVLLAEIINPNVSHDHMTKVYDGLAMIYDKVKIINVSYIFVWDAFNQVIYMILMRDIAVSRGGKYRSD